MPEEPSKKYWWVVGIVVPISVALIGVIFHGKNSNGNGSSSGQTPPVVISTPPQKPACSEALRSEHDDALKAVHMYDNSITVSEARLQEENGALALAQETKDDIHIAEHKSLAALVESQIKSLKESRDEAAQRVRDIEGQCVY